MCMMFFPSGVEEKFISYMFSPKGLYFSPLGRKGGRGGLANRIRSKCLFLGKFMAKAIMDSRMVSTTYIEGISFKNELDGGGERAE